MSCNRAWEAVEWSLCSSWYEMSVFYTNEEVKQYTFSGDLKKYDDFDKIIRMLEEVSGIKISIKENCVVIGTK